MRNEIEEYEVSKIVYVCPIFNAKLIRRSQASQFRAIEAIESFVSEIIEFFIAASRDTIGEFIRENPSRIKLAQFLMGELNGSLIMMEDEFELHSVFCFESKRAKIVSIHTRKTANHKN